MIGLLKVKTSEVVFAFYQTYSHADVVYTVPCVLLLSVIIFST